MQETCELPLNIKPEPGNEEIFRQSICDLLDRYKKDIGIFLSYYYLAGGELVEDVKLDSGINLTSPTSGYFTVSFQAVHFNACLDIHHINRDKMVLQVEWLSARNSVKLTGPFWPEREPDEI